MGSLTAAMVGYKCVVLFLVVILFRGSYSKPANDEQNEDTDGGIGSRVWGWLSYLNPWGWSAESTVPPNLKQDDSQTQIKNESVVEARQLTAATISYNPTTAQERASNQSEEHEVTTSPMASVPISITTEESTTGHLSEHRTSNTVITSVHTSEPAEEYSWELVVSTIASVHEYTTGAEEITSKQYEEPVVHSIDMTPDLGHPTTVHPVTDDILDPTLTTSMPSDLDKPKTQGEPVTEQPLEPEGTAIPITPFTDNPTTSEVLTVSTPTVTEDILRDKPLQLDVSTIESKLALIDPTTEARPTDIPFDPETATAFLVSSTTEEITSESFSELKVGTTEDHPVEVSTEPIPTLSTEGVEEVVFSGLYKPYVQTDKLPIPDEPVTDTYPEVHEIISNHVKAMSDLVMSKQEKEVASTEPSTDPYRLIQEHIMILEEEMMSKEKDGVAPTERATDAFINIHENIVKLKEDMMSKGEDRVAPTERATDPYKLIYENILKLEEMMSKEKDGMAPTDRSTDPFINIQESILKKQGEMMSKGEDRVMPTKPSTDLYLNIQKEISKQEEGMPTVPATYLYPISVSESAREEESIEPSKASWSTYLFPVVVAISGNSRRNEEFIERNELSIQTTPAMNPYHVAVTVSRKYEESSEASMLTKAADPNTEIDNMSDSTKPVLKEYLEIEEASPIGVHKAVLDVNVAMSSENDEEVALPFVSRSHNAGFRLSFNHVHLIVLLLGIFF